MCTFMFNAKVRLLNDLHFLVTDADLELVINFVLSAWVLFQQYSTLSKDPLFAWTKFTVKVYGCFDKN